MTTDKRDAEELSLTPAESLAVIENTLRETRRALGFSDWPFYLVWGAAWAVAFTATHLARSSETAPLAGLSDAGVGLLWIACIGAAVVATGVVAAHASHGVVGTTVRIGRRLAISWAAAFAAAGPLGGLLGLEDHEFGAFFVFVVALLYVGQGAAFLDDLQLGVGVWLLAVDVLALAAGPEWFNLVLAVFGAGAMLIAAAVARHSEQRTALGNG